MRNSYLVGRGELFQCVLDQLLVRTLLPTPPPQEMDRILNQEVLLQAAKLLGLEDRGLSSLLSLSCSHSSLEVGDFCSDHYQLRQQYCLAGDACVIAPSPSLQLCSPPPQADRDFSHLWTGHLRRHNQTVSDTPPRPEGSGGTGIGRRVGHSQYLRGAMWLREQRFIAKGFHLTCIFLLDWGGVGASLVAGRVQTDGRLLHTTSIIVYFDR